MAYEDQSLPVQLIKHPFVWSGVGLLIRYGGETTGRATVWKTLGVLALVVGIGHTVSNQQHGLVKQ